MQVGMFGERLQDPILGSRSLVYRLGLERSRITQQRKRGIYAYASMHFYPLVGERVLYLMALGIVG